MAGPGAPAATMTLARQAPPDSRVTDIRTASPPAWRKAAVGGAARGSTLRNVTVSTVPAAGDAVDVVATKAAAAIDRRRTVVPYGPTAVSSAT